MSNDPNWDDIPNDVDEVTEWVDYDYDDDYDPDKLDDWGDYDPDDDDDICPFCGGTGELDDDIECPDCYGTGIDGG